MLTQALTRDWIDQPAIARKYQLDPHRARQLTPNGPGDDEELGETERSIRRLIAEV